jgi:hypothetical protein
MNVVLRNMELTMVHLPTKTIITNKNRNLDFPFDFELVFNFNEDQTEMTYSFNITLRREFVFDTKSILKFYMITRMLEDKTSTVKITIPELEQPLYCKEGYGNREFTKEEYSNISKFVKEVEKIIFLEDTLDTRFKFDIDWLRSNSPAIDIAYAALSHEDVFVCGKTSWTIETDIENLNDLTINSVIRFESDLSTIDLFGEIYELPAMKLLMNDAMVKKIDIDKNKKKLIVEALSISVTPLV